MDILALSPHTDDIELGAGATIAKHVQSGDSVVVAAFSLGNPQTGATFEEYRNAMRALGVSEFLTSSYEARNYARDRQEILDYLIKLRERFQPQLVYTPAQTDVHQDHITVTQEAVRAFRFSTILGYELPYNAVEPQALRRFETVTDKLLQQKVAAINCYTSQAGRSYVREDLIYSLARVRGVMSGTQFAEGFEVIRWIGH